MGRGSTLTLTPFYPPSRRPMYCKTTASKMTATYDAFLLSGLPENRGTKGVGHDSENNTSNFLHVLSESLAIL
jgi:hypothetical protein